jgi:hypothetical protein
MERDSLILGILKLLGRAVGIVEVWKNIWGMRYAASKYQYWENGAVMVMLHAECGFGI